MSENPRIEELRRRVQLDPASIAFAALAEEYRRAGQLDDAIAMCRAGLLRHPAYLSAHVTLGRALLEIGQYDEARQELEHVLRLAPENLAAIRGLAEMHHRRGELPEALEQYKAALDVSGHDPELQDTVAQISRDVGESAANAEPAPPEAVEDAGALWGLPPGPLEQMPAAIEPASAGNAAGLASPQPAAAAVVVPLPRPDAAALAGLEDFLQAIVRARRDIPETAAATH